ncbi:hypothetical protein [Streptomyces sp. YIM 130001]|nr:hypothetical protein [Streptomyces sp. YIM 130001]
MEPSPASPRAEALDAAAQHPDATAVADGIDMMTESNNSEWSVAT